MNARSVDPVADSKPNNGMTPTVQNGHTNGDLNHMRAENGPTRTRSMDSDKIVEWEPSPEEKEIIKQTWSDDFSFLYELGSSIYVYIFNHNPEAKKLFPTIHQHGEKYKESKEFRAQALKFVQAISHTVKNIYHMNDLAPYLSDIGRRHVKFAERGFKPEYWDLFLDAMEHSLSDQINSIQSIDDTKRAKAVQVWRRLAFYIITHLKRGFFAEMDRLEMK
ncbi:unnamed protein product [Bursaphelenchus okinawaensis]|uniref:Globin domain-containing protein n=1 Tax=Bursaphelenchus okinawaensis TaxID=465554 RepID=A0A811JVP9_9BILA|nr:unnamed protein product [Bursaphelenchus okinawaensis]CAG9085960.1 unnamed protein product [Bursaphelenchus okinawaensis]